jgi:hypothetical protein
VRAWDLTTNRVLEATLHRGRDLRVELVDAEGRPIPGARVRAEIAGFGPPWKIENDVAGVHVLCDVPSGRADVEIELAGRTYARSHEGPGDVVRFVLPGEYTVGLEVGTPSTGDADTVYAPLREPKRITVRGGETLRLEL